MHVHVPGKHRAANGAEEAMQLPGQNAHRCEETLTARP